MDFIAEVWNRAKKLNKTIVFPETGDVRILKATELILKSKLAKIILIGSPIEIERLARNSNIEIEGVEVINPVDSPKLEDYIKRFFKKREKKGISREEATRLISTDTPYFGAMMVDASDADGMVTGAMHTTSDTLHAALQCVGVKEEIKLVSSFFAMILPKKEFGEEGLIFFADCGVVIDPNSSELADIAISTADSFRKLTFREPRIAMLSFSTKGSAEHILVEKVRKATEIVKSKKPDLIIDGELQADAALIPGIGKKKAPGSEVAGRANILIFPDLDAGNIAYKLVERLGGAKALGPILQGLKKPVNDLSRGCSVDDIVNVTAITAVQCQ